MCKPRGPRRGRGVRAEMSTATTHRVGPNQLPCLRLRRRMQTLEGLIPGIDGSARAFSDVFEARQPHPAESRPRARIAGLLYFVRLRAKLDGCLTGRRLAKDRRLRIADKSDDARGAALSGVTHWRDHRTSQIARLNHSPCNHCQASNIDLLRTPQLQIRMKTKQTGIIVAENPSGLIRSFVVNGSFWIRFGQSLWRINGAIEPAGPP